LPLWVPAFAGMTKRGVFAKDAIALRMSAGHSSGMAAPSSNDLAFLVGKEVARVAFETMGVHFIWEGGGEIHAMGPFIHLGPDGVWRQCDDVFLDPPSLLPRLIQRRVAAVGADGNGFTLVFDDRQELTFDASGLGENGLIQFATDLAEGWIVF
jgi:hypothetical protein